MNIETMDIKQLEKLALNITCFLSSAFELANSEAEARHGLKRIKNMDSYLQNAKKIFIKLGLMPEFTKIYNIVTTLDWYNSTDLDVIDAELSERYGDDFDNTADLDYITTFIDVGQL